MFGFGFKLFTQLVEIELLLTEPQSFTSTLDTREMPVANVVVNSYIVNYCHLVDGFSQG